MAKNQVASAELRSSPEIVELRSGRMGARISPQGAFIEELWLDDSNYGRPNLLFPKQQLEISQGLRTRGGSHVCLPVFGPSKELEQHGFGRNLPWTILDQSEDRITMSLTIDGNEPVRGAKHYSGLLAQLEYGLKDEEATGPELDMSLSVANNGAGPMSLTPGFHPYFLLPRGVTVDNVAIYNVRAPGNFGQRTFSPTELSETSYVSSENAQLEMHNLGLAKVLGIVISHENLPVNAIWTDNPNTYICVEPTASGVQQAPLRESDLLFPRQNKSYSAKISWRGF